MTSMYIKLKNVNHSIHDYLEHAKGVGIKKEVRKNKRKQNQ